MEKHVNFIYNKITSFNPLVKHLCKDDVLQEIRIAIFTSTQSFKEAGININRLAKEYGFSRKKGKDNFHKFYQYYEPENDFIKYIESIYIDHTCREVCTILQIDYNKRIQKLFHQVFPKNAGWGGRRKNSGAKKNKNENSSKVAC